MLVILSKIGITAKSFFIELCLRLFELFIFEIKSLIKIMFNINPIIDITKKTTGINSFLE